ncbi:MAG: TolB family protein [Planctomycetaceae bacterium]
MTLEDRARRASLGIRQAVGAVGVLPHERLDRFFRYRARIQRNRRVGAVALAALLTVGVVALVKGAFDTSGTMPAAPPGRPSGTILYARWMPNVQQGRWFTIAPDGSHETDLHITATCAVWWPSGDRILITDDSAFGPDQPLRPATVAPDGTDLHALDATRDPNLNLGCGDVSPDGSRIALEGFGRRNRATHGIYTVRSRDGGDLVRLSTGADSYPIYSPDGSRLVFLRTKPGVVPDGAGALFVMNADGTAQRRITPWGGAFLNYAWSPDGRWIAFEQPYGRLALVHPDGTGSHVVPVTLPAGSGATNPSWSPDGRWIAFSLTEGTTATIAIVRPDGSDLTIVTHASGLPENAPNWGP